MHAYEAHAHETPVHHYFSGPLAQTVVDLSRSECQNTSFCASCEVVPITLGTSVRQPSSQKWKYATFEHEFIGYMQLACYPG